MKAVDEIEVTRTGPHRYEVGVTRDGTTTRHRVRVPDGMPEQMGAPGGEEERLVRESFRFLLERESATSILSEFDLDVISRYFPEYPSEISTRLS